jgi:hypothetical protein
MTSGTRFSAAGLALGMFLLVAGCSRESSQKQPVTTTTEKGASTSAPANEVQSG